METQEFGRFMHRARKLFPAIDKLADNSPETVKQWRRVLDNQELDDCMAALDLILDGKVEMPTYTADIWRFAYVVKFEAANLKEKRNKDASATQRREENYQARRKQKTHMNNGLLRTIQSLGCADIFMRAVELMKEGFGSADACNQAATELKVPWWEPL